MARSARPPRKTARVKRPRPPAARKRGPSTPWKTVEEFLNNGEGLGSRALMRFFAGKPSSPWATRFDRRGGVGERLRRSALLIWIDTHPSFV